VIGTTITLAAYAILADYIEQGGAFLRSHLSLYLYRTQNVGVGQRIEMPFRKQNVK